jgi:hypothetical protein
MEGHRSEPDPKSPRRPLEGHLLAERFVHVEFTTSRAPKENALAKYGYSAIPAA